TTPGSYDITFNNGVGSMPFDCAITKFNPSGTNLLYSIYFGGSGNETPHSIVAGPTGELYVYGVTCSSNFPITNGAYDGSFNGGPSVTENSLTFNGSDIFIARFSTNGANLIASTYLGGNNLDGLNINTLHYNYGDQFRGEIILDGSGNVYISSTTASNNFPTTPGVYSTSLSGNQDAVVCKLNNTLTSLLWSSYFGGSGSESGNSIDLSPNGQVYVAGGSTSPNFPGVGSGNTLNNNGGISDGYLARFNPSNGSVTSATFLGANEYDQAYFVRCDPSNLVYVYGQTESNWAITPGCSGTPNSGQFIRKYDGTLQNIQWSTVFGAGTGHVEISPTAFLVSDCYEIYVAGWGGQLNANSSVSQATHSTTNGFITTPGAFQTNTNGSNFYLGVFKPNAQAVDYATYMGGLTGSSNHVDGGTSRFDKKGRIYHAVCGACGGNNYGFTSTPGSWSPQNPSPNCNMAVFKFDLSTLDAIIAQPSPLICIPQPVVFTNNSVNGNSFFWDFGDNTSSNQFQPSHLYASAGVYNVSLIVSDSANCYVPDTAFIQVNIGDFQGGVTLPTQAICPGSPFQLDAFGGSSYLWSPANLLSNPNVANPIATVNSNTVFSVIISDSCGSDTLQVPLNVVPLSLTLTPDTSICIGAQVPLNASGQGSIAWNASPSLNTLVGNNVIATPSNTTTYTATLTSPEGCVLSDSTTVTVYFTPPVSNLPDTLIVCLGESTTLTVNGANTYSWSPNTNISSVTGSTVTLWPQQNMYYFCQFTNACGTLEDSVYITLLTANITAGNDTIICPSEVAHLWANGGVYYQWSPSSSIVNQATNQVWVIIALLERTSTVVRIRLTSRWCCIPCLRLLFLPTSKLFTVIKSN
ncbi:MAG: PKD domain-containing protein, partial [Flavobacteriia bacterium]|nr:PKD domain-containing protein [Flavobacteriia bacterium]